MFNKNAIFYEKGTVRAAPVRSGAAVFRCHCGAVSVREAPACLTWHGSLGRVSPGPGGFDRADGGFTL